MDLSMQIVKQALVDEDTKDLGKNFMFSPLSLTTLLSMVASGLKGETLEKIMSLLGFKTLADLISDSYRVMSMESSDNSQGPLVFSSVNGAWVDKKFKLNSSFQQVLKTIYKADSFTLDFDNNPHDAIDEINAWVGKATKGLIKKTLSRDVLNETMLILTNVLYFKGFWVNPFIPRGTWSEKFYTLSGDTVQVPYLSKGRARFSYGAYQGFKILGMPYKKDTQKGRIFSMYFFLPDEKDGLPKLLEQLSSDSALLNLQFELKKELITALMIPKFKFKYDFEVSKIMEKMGLALNVKEDAEMLETLNGADAKPADAKVFHTCFIEVNEYGTEAAAATTFFPSGAALTSPPPMEFIADHPFVFMIREDTSETPIFVGVVVNPLQE